MLSPAIVDAATPIKAKAVYVEGSVNVISTKDNKSRLVKTGDLFVEGDKIVTEKDGVVEIKFDTGALIRIDVDTQMIVTSLHRNDSGSTFSIFNLIAGRVKSAVTKLVDDKSKFEYQTKAAISGVSGTPPFIVEALGAITNIDLFGGEGDEGALYVIGFDPAKTMITLFPGHRTIIRRGQASGEPFKILPKRRQKLNIEIPFKSLSIEQSKKITMHGLERRISIPRPERDGVSYDGEELETQYDQGPGVSAGNTGGLEQILIPGSASITIR